MKVKTNFEDETQNVTEGRNCIGFCPEEERERERGYLYEREEEIKSRTISERVAAERGGGGPTIGEGNT